MKNLMLYLGPFLALLRHYLSDEAVDVIKEAATFAVAQTEWAPGQRTQYVVDTALRFTAATPTKADDWLVQIGAILYLKRYTARAKVPRARSRAGSATRSPGARL